MAGWKVFLSVVALMLLDTASARSIRPGCPKDKPRVFCLFNPCYYTRCPRFPDARCKEDYCGGCNARFFMGKTEVTDYCYRDMCVAKDGDRIKCDGLCKDSLQGLYCDPSCDINNGGCAKDQVCMSRGFCNTFRCQNSVRCVERGVLCSMKPERGPCKAYIRSYFYSVTSQSCKKFIYGGCGGNVNRFSNLRDCQRTCRGVTEPVNPCVVFECLHGTRCKVNPSTGLPFCEQSCKYNNGGCADGELCREKQTICITQPCIKCLKPSEVCTLKPVPGPCRGFIPSYFFNSTSGRCEKFTYGGCGGNDNRFSLLKDCREFCGKVQPTKNPCHVVFCGPDGTCRVNKLTGEAECVSRTHPCAAILCGPNTICRVNRKTRQGYCGVDPCTHTKCGSGQVCQYNQEIDNSKCVPRPTLPPCFRHQCLPGQICQVNKETGNAECVFQLKG